MTDTPEGPDRLDLQADADQCPMRVDAYLAENLPEFSRSRLAAVIKAGQVWVDGERCKPSLKLQGGEAISLIPPEPDEIIPEPEDIPLEVLYEDDDILVINKAAGMVVHPGAGVREGTLVNALLHHCDHLSRIGGAFRPGIVHRLDRLTSGCLAVAKTDAAHRSLTAQLATRRMGRIYLAWASGVVTERSGLVDAPIGRSSRERTRMAVVRGGRPAITHWQVEAWGPGVTRLLCRLETGRTHQIRVHCEYMGFPIIGDGDYGFDPQKAKLRVPPGHPAIIQAIAKCQRQMLHAWRLHLTHPSTGKELEVEAPLPEDFRQFDQAVAPYATFAS
ncbi:MAG: RluA family pseudouridine synthase [Candidatus Sumerlaeia bacterium]